ncbi:MAG: hypothetical protein Fur0037_10020 [Planctomycetota bacterium]
MKKLVVNAIAGSLLFAGSLVGMLAATGRLNHEGTAGIPVLGSLFPPPAEPADEAMPENAAAARREGEVAEAAAGGEHAAARDASAQGAAAPQGQPGKLRPKEGKSIHPQAKPEGGGGHGEAPAEGEGEGGHKAEEAKPAPHGETAPAPAHAAEDGAAAKVASDFDHLQSELRGLHSGYEPGSYFRFDGMPSGITADQLDQAYKRVQKTIEDLDKRKMALDLREQDLLLLEKDIARRQAELGKERLALEAMQKELDARIAEFKQQVTIIQADEVEALKRNAATFASFGAQKGAELVQEQWKTEQGQKEVVKLLELMDKEAVDNLIAALPNAMIRDILEKRLHVATEKPKKGGRK